MTDAYLPHTRPGPGPAPARHAPGGPHAPGTAPHLGNVPRPGVVPGRRSASGPVLSGQASDGPGDRDDAPAAGGPRAPGASHLINDPSAGDVPGHGSASGPEPPGRVPDGPGDRDKVPAAHPPHLAGAPHLATTPGPSGAADGDVPAWLRELAARVARFPVPLTLRPPAEGGRRAAVLLLFGEGPHGPDILLIQRSARGRLHAGQPAFPGGGVDPEDGGPIGAALREAEEETGLDPSGVAVLGTMPELYVSRSANRVTPVLGWWHTPCAVYPAAPDEVAAVERVPIAELVDPRNRLRLRGPSGYIGPAFRVRGLLVWGFTAGVLNGVLATAGFERPWDRSRIEDLPPDMRNLAAR